MSKILLYKVQIKKIDDCLFLEKNLPEEELSDEDKYVLSCYNTAIIFYNSPEYFTNVFLNSELDAYWKILSIEDKILWKKSLLQTDLLKKLTPALYDYLIKIIYNDHRKSTLVPQQLNFKYVLDNIEFVIKPKHKLALITWAKNYLRGCCT